MAWKGKTEGTMLWADNFWILSEQHCGAGENDAGTGRRDDRDSDGAETGLAVVDQHVHAAEEDKPMVITGAVQMLVLAFVLTLLGTGTIGICWKGP